MKEKLEMIIDEMRNLLAANKIVCPHCGRELDIQISASAASKKRSRGVKPQKSKPSTKKYQPKSRNKRSTAISKRRAINHTTNNDQLPDLALRYAREKYNGRIGEAYRAVREGIGATKDKSKEEIRAMKLKWFNKHLAVTGDGRIFSAGGVRSNAVPAIWHLSF